jgi:hypothetical protein
VTSGIVVRLDVQMWPTGIVFDAGEKLVLRITGKKTGIAALPHLPRAVNADRGQHVLYLRGGRFEGLHHRYIVIKSALLGAPKRAHRSVHQQHNTNGRIDIIAGHISRVVEKPRYGGKTCTRIPTWHHTGRR